MYLVQRLNMKSMIEKRKSNRRKSSGRRIADVPGRRVTRRRKSDKKGNNRLTLPIKDSGCRDTCTHE